MKRLIVVLIVSFSGAVLSACEKSSKSEASLQPSFKEAEEACNIWKSEGGTWKLKINDFRISANEQEDASGFPIQVESSDDKSKEDLTSQEEEKELTVYLPLLTSGKDRLKDKQEFEIETIGDKWLTYDRRLCKIDDKDNNIILGKEYLIDSDEKVLRTNIPSLIIKKSFPFYK